MSVRAFSLLELSTPPLDSSRCADRLAPNESSETQTRAERRPETSGRNITQNNTRYLIECAGLLKTTGGAVKLARRRTTAGVVGLPKFAHNYLKMFILDFG